MEKLKEEKENQEAQYEEEFREFEIMANEKVVQLEEYYVQQLQMKEVHVQQLQAQLSQALVKQHQQQKIENAMNGNLQTQQANQQLTEQMNELKAQLTNTQEMSKTLTAENTKLQSEIKNLQYHEKVITDQRDSYKKKNQAGESKISAYNDTFLKLAQKLKQLNDDTTTLRKEKSKVKKKCDKLEKTKKKLKDKIKDLNEKIENRTAVAKDLVQVKNDYMLQSKSWEKEKIKYNEKISKLENEILHQNQKKFETINAYNVEMNNLRANIKTLQRRIQSQQSEMDKLQDDSASVLGSAANWVGGSWWGTKK